MRIAIHFNVSGLDELYRQAEQQVKKEMLNELARTGEGYVNMARGTGTYTDRTGNLRNANSYRIYKDGIVVSESIGRPETGKMFDELKSGIGIEALFGNGMEYASFVEGKGYNVVSEAFLWVEKRMSSFK
ncbi:MAG: hypothetical protein LBP50_03255 [Tannerella sp.]|nr:hypothetical protein [Tannerella sp.]